MSKKQQIKIKVLAGIVLISMVLALVGPIPFSRKVAQAIPVEGGPVTTFTQVVQDFPKDVSETRGKIEKTILSALANAGLTALTNALLYFAQKLAYDAAVYVATYGEGQTPLVYQQTWGEYMQQAGEETLGEFIGTLSEPFEEYGFNLCEPSADVKIGIIVPLLEERFKPPKPRCEFRQVLDNWDKFGGYVKSEEFLKSLAPSFDPRKNDIGVFLSLNDVMLAKLSSAEKAKEKKREEEAPFKAVTELITGKIQTPAQMVETGVEESLSAGWDVQQATINMSYLDLLKHPEQWFFPAIASTFMNTFLAKLSQRLYRGFFDTGLPEPDDLAGGGRTGRGRRAVEVAYQDLTIPLPGQATTIDLLNEFQACPSGGVRGPNSCVIDSSLAQAVRRAAQGEPLTVAEAVEMGFLHSDWPLVPPELESRYNRGVPCRDEAYCYSNLVKLRKARILPLGFEIAAKKSTKGGSEDPITLKTVLDNFNNPDPNSDWYRLIDPNWILKYPDTQCRAETYGASLLTARTSERQETCVDTPSCVEEDEGGSCKGAWGYCVREKNIWRFRGDECDAQFDSCQTFKRRDGAAFSYLKKTLQGERDCNLNNVGCSQYSLSKGEDGKWNTDKRIYLTAKAAQCNVKEEGCAEFLKEKKERDEQGNIQYDSIYLKKAPASLGSSCNPQLNSRENILNSDCSRFALQCTQEEEGCELYTPRKNGAGVPAKVIGTKNPPTGDYCPRECVGFQSYLQEKTNFEKLDSPLAEVDFIADRAETCSAAEAGCDEFTNLDELAKGGEAEEYFTYLRQCIKPNEPNAATFYTWEGSDTEGYQLKRWQLKKDSVTGAPATTDQSTNCDFNTNTNPDCRQFYNEAGQVFYRFWSMTISVSDNCHPYRKTESNQSDCEATGAGGNWENNQCIYKGTPTEGSLACSAAASGCRGYKGPASNNIRIMFSDDFERGETAGWVYFSGVGDTELSSEALNVGGHSYKFWQGSVEKDVSSLMTPGGFYQLSFWIKSSTADSRVLVYIKEEGGGFYPVSELTLGENWQSYLFDLNDLDFQPKVIGIGYIGGTAEYFIDVITLKEISKIYRVKDSFNVPRSCVAAGTDNKGNPITIPVMRNCQEYRTRPESPNQGNSVYLKGFDRLCRSEAVGCQKLVDPQNYLLSEKKDRTDGKAFNRNNDEVIENGAEDNVDIPPWDPWGREETYTYLVVDRAKQCQPSAKGCQLLGNLNSPRLDDDKNIIGYEDVYLKNNPDSYVGPDSRVGIDGPILCQIQEDRCEQFEPKEGGITGPMYFKKPSQTCEWKTGINPGWFDKISSEPCIPTCEWKTGINPGWFDKISSEPCIPNNPDWTTIRTSTDWEPGWTAECPSKQNQCTAFIDPRDEKPYFYLNNNKLDRTSCAGQVSEKEGCILFDDTSQNTKERVPILSYNSALTYQASERQNYGLVSPSEEGDKDTNSILKVIRDRVCGAWLSCRSSSTDYDPNTQKPIESCTQFDLCQEFERADRRTQCSKFVKQNDTKLRVDLLNEGKYKARGVAAEDLEFSGYSLFDKYQIYDLKSVNVSSVPENEVYRLVYVMPTERCSGEPGSSCGLGGKGSCFVNKCVVGINGGKVTPENPTNQTLKSSGYLLNQSTLPPLVRGYREKDAPFPSSDNKIVETWSAAPSGGDSYPDAETRIEGFDMVNLCAKNQSCEESYQKVTYGGGLIKYFRLNETAPTGLCQGGWTQGGISKDGLKCTSSLGCKDERDERVIGDFPEDGTCQLKKKVQRVNNWMGDCLEPDLSQNINGQPNEFACLTWMPTDQPLGGMDIYNQYKQAGYFPDEQEYYCAAETATPFEHGPITNNALIGLSSNSFALFPSVTTGSGEIRIDLKDLGFNDYYDKSDIEKIRIDFTSAEDTSEWPTNEKWIRYIDLDPSNNWRIGWCSDNSCDGYGFRNIGPRIEAREEGQGGGWDLSGQDFFTDKFNKFWNDDDGLGRENSDICSDADRYNNNAFALQVVFDEEKKLKGFKSALCDGTKASGWMNVDITIYFRNACTEIARTAWNDPNEGIVTKAKTNKVWEGGNTSVFGYLYNTATIPFGRITTPTSDNAKEWVPARDFFGDLTDFNQEEKIPAQVKKTDEHSAEAHGFTGSPYGCLGKYGASCRRLLGGGPPEGDYRAGASRIQQLFAKVYDIFRWEISEDKYSNESVLTRTITSDVSGIEGKPPAIASTGQPQEGISPLVKIGKKMTALNDFTVNDKNRDSVNKNVVINSDDAVYLEFYAWADTNQMPLRSIVIDFDNDNSPDIGPLRGKYQNHKPYCSEEDAPTNVCSYSGNTDINVTCNPDTTIGNSECRGVYNRLPDDTNYVCTELNRDTFGNTPNACTANYFEFFHVYSCNQPTSYALDGTPLFSIDACRGDYSVSNLPCWESDISRLVPNQTGGACIFKPRVQVKDNWGWCNGKCGDATSPGGTGCYDASGDDGADECNVNDPTFSHWTEFAGKIIVVPR